MKKIYVFMFIFLMLVPCVLAQEASLSQATSPAGSSDKITLDIKGMDIVDVLKMLSSKAHLNMVIDKNVSGRVTVFLTDVSPQEALKAILDSNGLIAEKEGQIIRVMTVTDYEQRSGEDVNDPKETIRIKLRNAKPQMVAQTLNQVKSNIGHIVVDDTSGTLILIDTQKKNSQMLEMIKEMDMPCQTQVFKLNYARCEKIAELLQDVVTRDIGSIKIDNRSNQLIITDYAGKLNKIQEMIASLDEKTKEVLIDAKIVQVSLDHKTSLGIDWEYVLNKKLNVKGMFGQVITTTGNKWTIGTAQPKNTNDYSAIIEVLDTVGETRILSSPRLTVTNNESAKILVGSKQVYVTTAAIQSQTSTETAESVNFVDVGVKLFVTPTISHDGSISMKVRPEVSSVVQNYKTAAGNNIPIVETSEAETTILMQDGATIIIAGLMKEEKTKNINKIPILGDIPFLGAFFRNSTEQSKKTELVIFLTCHII